jgi:hypothetical protein
MPVAFATVLRSRNDAQIGLNVKAAHNLASEWHYVVDIVLPGVDF